MPRPARGRGRLAVVRSGPGASSATSSSRTSGYGSSRMGWERPWYTITDSFDADFGVDGWHGTSALLREGGQISRTYVIDSRGDEAFTAKVADHAWLLAALRRHRDHTA
jgi:hypothetical protein